MSLPRPEAGPVVLVNHIKRELQWWAMGMNVWEETRKNLTAESKAYGYTLSVWGTGALLITFYPVELIRPIVILSFVLGGVTGFGVMALMAFRGIFLNYDYAGQDRMVVASMVHVLASFGTVSASYIFAIVMHPWLSPFTVFFLLGFHASISYNILLLAEHLLSKYAMTLEKQVLGARSDESQNV